MKPSGLLQSEPTREWVMCDLCGSDHARIRLVVNTQTLILSQVWIDDVPHQMPGEEKLVECENCGLVYINPRLAPLPGLAPYSTEQEFTYFESTREVRRRAYRTIWQQMPRWLGRKPSSLLDIGCGDGVLLEVAQTPEIELMGLEVSRPLIELARQRLRGKFVYDYEAVRILDHHFDIVTLFNVLEHVRRPSQMLLNVARYIKPGGIVLVHVPNFGGLPARLAGSRWRQIEPFAHFYYFTARTLGQFLGQAGFEPFGRFSLIVSQGWRGRVQHWTDRLGIFVDSGLGIVARRSSA